MSQVVSIGKSLRTSASTITDEPDGASDERPLPHGWMQVQDPQTLCWFYVDPSTDPPRSSWRHPLDDPIASRPAPVSTTSEVPGKSSYQPQPSSARSPARNTSVSEGCTSATPQDHTPSTGYGQLFSKLMAKFSSPDSMVDREWAAAERKAARAERERAARRRRQAVLLQRVRALEAERDAYHSGGVGFPHEELLAQARDNAVAAGAYSPWGGHGHSGDGSSVGADDVLPPYTPATGVQSDAFRRDSQREQPSQGEQSYDTIAHNGVAHMAGTGAR